MPPAVTYSTMNELVDKTDPRLRRIARLVIAMGMLAVLPVFTAVTITNGAEVPASPPCDGSAPQPPYASPGDAPNVQVWKDWTLPQFSIATECHGWSTTKFRTLVAIAGTLRTADGPDALLSRFGEVSGL